MGVRLISIMFHPKPCNKGFQGAPPFGPPGGPSESRRRQKGGEFWLRVGVPHRILGFCLSKILKKRPGYVKCLTMELNFTPEALSQLDIIGAAETVTNGFLFGCLMGKQLIIRQLLPVNFETKNLDAAYSGTFTRSDAVVGVFFNRGEPFDSDWFIGDLVLTIDTVNNRPLVTGYLYQEGGKRTPLPIPLGGGRD